MEGIWEMGAQDSLPLDTASRGQIDLGLYNLMFNSPVLLFPVHVPLSKSFIFSKALFSYKLKKKKERKEEKKKMGRKRRNLYDIYLSGML